MVIYIYTLTESGKNDVRWVGQTHDPKARLRSHRSTSASVRNQRKISWIRSIDSKVEMHIIESTTKDLVDAREEFWISHFKSLGCDLLNIKSGGNASRGYKQTPESILKRTIAMKAAVTDEQRNRMRKIGESNRGKTSNRKGVILDDSTKSILSSIFKGRPNFKNRRFDQTKELEIFSLTKTMKTIDIAKQFECDQSTIYEIKKRYS